ncbi:alpha/beta hydrolase [Bordetella sp. BOR01]|uniref:alpha/beta hydrolase n=1 Tax=Bordetella sp. BOR01 TaxID=2854779 RepID=UPI001C488643|nr:alpha/beta hydrolase [Bordetella sp. BOR01]MBV7484722.1 alpha/beta hydrolase [Bordetella sp. BOR01]
MMLGNGKAVAGTCKLIRVLALAACALVLTGCSSPVRLMPTPLKFTTGYVDPFARGGQNGKSSFISLFYATNRAVLLESRQPVYTIFPSDTLRLGTALVRIGDGTLDWDRITALSTSDVERGRPILSLERLDEQASFDIGNETAPNAQTRAFLADINRALDASPQKDLIVYVHGFNNAVWRGTAQAAQFHHFTGRQAVVLAFLWPSAGSLLSYATDVRVARASVPAFARLVDMLLAHTDAEHINILAFSAGARIASEGLAVLSRPRQGESPEDVRARLRLGQVYFAAPDEDVDRFVADLSTYIPFTSRVTLSANMNDSALRLAARHQGIARAGRPNREVLDSEQWRFVTDASKRQNFDIINIDSRKIPGLHRRAHGFWYGNAWVSSDVLMQFLWHKPPQERGLESHVTSGGLRFWAFPPDYEARVRTLLRER